MIPPGYWQRPDTPQRNSPVGKLMQKAEAEFPEMEVEFMREKARDALKGVGGSSRVQIAYSKLLKCLAIAQGTIKDERGVPA